MSWHIDEAFIEISGGPKVAAALSNFYFIIESNESWFGRYSNLENGRLSVLFSMDGIRKISELPDVVRKILPDEFSGVQFELGFLSEETEGGYDMSEALREAPTVTFEAFLFSLACAGDLISPVTVSRELYDSQHLYGGNSLLIETEQPLKFESVLDPSNFNVIRGKVSINTNRLDCDVVKLHSFGRSQVPGRITSKSNLVFDIRVAGRPL